MLKHIVLLGLLYPMLAGAEPLDKIAAIVNNEVITVSELNRQVDVMRQQIIAKQMQLPAESTLHKQVLQHLIDVNLELQLAKQNKIAIDEPELNEAIAKIAAANHLSITELRDELKRQGLSWKEYQENIRNEMLISRIQQKAVSKEITVTPAQVENYLKSYQQMDKSQTTYHLQNIIIPLPENPSAEQINRARQKANDLLSKITPGMDFNQLAALESNQEFTLETGDLGERHLTELPEVFAKEVVHMQQGQVSKPIQAANGFQLVKLVNMTNHKQQHQVTKTHVRHILLQQNTITTALEAKKQINNLYQQLKAGKDFASLAKHFSQDAATADKGGDLGWVTPGELVPEFEKTMNSLAPNQISKPVKTSFGWHLIQVLGRNQVDDTDNYQRQQVKQFLQQQKFAEAVQQWQQQLRNQAYIKIVDKDLK